MSSESNNREKSPAESHAEVIVRMFPSDANPAGNVFGGEILKHIDMVAGIVAQRHSQSNSCNNIFSFCFNFYFHRRVVDVVYASV